MSTARATRAARFATLSALTILALTVACVLAVLIAARFKIRVDTTAAGRHSLTPRTATILRNLDEPIDLVLSANLTTLRSTDHALRQRIDDVLASFADASPNVRVMLIDTGLPGAVDAYARLLAGLAQREADDIARARDTLRRALDEAASLTDELPPLADHCRLIADDAPEDTAAQWRDAAGVIDRIAAELDDVLNQARPLTDSTFADVTLPQPDAARQLIEPVVQRTGRALSALESHALNQPTSLPTATLDRIARAGDLARNALQTTAAILDHLTRAPRLDILNVARLLRERQALLAIGPDAVAALDFQTLFPPTDASAAFAGEDVIAGAIATAASQTRPALVLVHTETERLLDENARPTPRAQASIGDLTRTLALRRFTIAEWPVALDAPMPTHATLDLQPDAPIIWFVLGAPLASAENGFERISKLGDAVRRLADRGQSILLTINPSDLPAIGEPNPVAAPLADFALDADSGRVVVTRASTPSGPSFAAEHTLRRANTDHPVGAAIDALATYLPSASPITLLDPPDNVSRAPLLTIDDDENTWAEARWQSPPPSPDPAQDRLQGPYVVAAAAERRRAPTEPAALPGNRQRIVAVAAAQWYVDPITGARTSVEGRQAARFPGNRRLLTAAATWLSGRDELIAPSHEVRDIPRIKPLTPAQITAIRWLLIAGLPALVLATGAALRLLRR